jgi:hypothetical protein
LGQTLAGFDVAVDHEPAGGAGKILSRMTSAGLDEPWSVPASCHLKPECKRCFGRKSAGGGKLFSLKLPSIERALFARERPPRPDKITRCNAELQLAASGGGAAVDAVLEQNRYDLATLAQLLTVLLTGRTPGEDW